MTKNSRMNFKNCSIERNTVSFASPRLHIEKRNGSLIVKSCADLGYYARCLGDLLHHWAETTPERIFLAERAIDQESWSTITYKETLVSVRKVAQWLSDRGLTPERPVMILSGNSINHAILSLAAMYIGIPSVPVSPFYSLVSKDFARLKYVCQTITPALIFVENTTGYEAAINALSQFNYELICCQNSLSGKRVVYFQELLSTTATGIVDDAFHALHPGTVAKILFTSGSTGLPKGVINTHRMLCSNQQSIAQCWPFLTERPPLILDWLPWNHTFGANHNFNMILHNGGTLYIDGGKPAPGLIDMTVKNLREISPTIYFNVPRGYDMLMEYLEKDALLAESFFRNLDLIFYAAAPLPSKIWDRLKALSKRYLGYEVLFVSAWGATETSPMVTIIHFPVSESSNIGIPAPGSELKMVPYSGKFELRVRGPNVTPGYWRLPEKTENAFDEEGFYYSGDSGEWIDEFSPEKGIRFVGRIAEDFKLSTGTWVTVNAIRLKLNTMLKPLISDAVITGHGRDYVGALVFVNPEGFKELLSDQESLAGATLADSLKHQAVRIFVIDRLKLMKQQESGSSKTVQRIILMDQPPSPDANEITDKGYINQKAVLERRKDLVDKLYCHPHDPEVILLDA